MVLNFYFTIDFSILMLYLCYISIALKSFSIYFKVYVYTKKQ